MEINYFGQSGVGTLLGTNSYWAQHYIYIYIYIPWAQPYTYIYIYISPGLSTIYIYIYIPWAQHYILTFMPVAL